MITLDGIATDCVSFLCMRIQTMHQRLNISLPDTTVRLLDRVAPKGDRSKFIDQAVRSEISRATKAKLRHQLAEGYRSRAEEDRQLTAEWDQLSAEVWAHLDRDEGR
jgi:CopG family transcriptional regulator / antitoxin EndoAI